MAANKAIRLGPVAMSNTVADIFNPPTLTGGTNPPALSTTLLVETGYFAKLNSHWTG
jgi:hypothetical protein